MRILIGLMVALTLASPAFAAESAEELVRALYAMPQIPIKARDIDHYFARDLAAAIKKDISGGEVGETNDGDYRYDAQETKITGLAFKASTNQAGGNVAVTFKNFGKASGVTYSMCQVKGVWRIADVETPDFHMRKQLNLPVAPVRC